MGDLVGYIGTGLMGSGMVARLLESGVSVVVHDKDPAAVERLIRHGAESGESPRSVADRASIVFACLPSIAASRAVAFGDDGVKGGRAMRTYVEMSTLGSEAVEEIANEIEQSGVSMLDAPISGGVGAARKGTLSIMVSGDRAAFEEHTATFRALSQTLLYVGEQPGLAQVYKLVNNVISIGGTVLAYEAFVAGLKAGLDPKMLLDVINSGSGRNSATVRKIPEILSSRPEKFASIGTLKKDIDLYLKEAAKSGAASWIGSAVEQFLRFAIIQEGAEQEGAGIMKLYAKWAGVDLANLPSDC
jgi:3-hydroxyisobutyrate dehydrogenase-like beta-hydroxyacid dehydrogenase